MLQRMRSAAKWIWIFIFVFFVGGFLFAETSGLLGREVITTGSVVGEVNGEDISYIAWQNLANALQQQQERQSGRSLTLDERRQIEDQAFEQLVTEVLLRQEYERRKISVSDDEIRMAAETSPPPDLMQSPELQTDGQFDLAKYQRLLRSSAARQNGLLVQLENFYRTEIPRAKLYDQLAGDVWVSDAKLWNVYKDLNDSAKVSFVAFDPATIADSAVTVSDAEIRTFYNANKERFERTGRAIVSLLTIPRTVTASDSAAILARANNLRSEILGGVKFEDVARRESVDTVSAAQGGSLGRGAKGRFVPEFEEAAYKLRVNEISQPVVSPFGVHLIQVTEKKGDTLDLRHILLRVQQSDSNATRTDRRADSLAAIAAEATEPQRLDSAAKVLGMTPERAEAIEGQVLFAGGRMVPSVSAWAFSGVKEGELSDLFDSDDAYVIARLDSLYEGGVAPLNDVRNEISAFLARRKKAEKLVPSAEALAKEAKASSLDAAARTRGLEVKTSDTFTRAGFVPGLGRLNAAIGAAFTLPVNAVSAPVVTDEGVFVLRVDRRVEANRADWEKQKENQRRQALQALRENRIRGYLDGLRKSAEIEDNRKRLNAAAREAAAIVQ